MKPRPKPLLGLLLGLLLGAVIVALLWQLGVAPPDRFILFGVLALSIALVELLLTQTTRRGKKRFVTTMVIAGVFGGVALTGIPETFMDAGSISDGCTLTMTSATDEASPTDTSTFDPFDTTPDDTVSFTSSTDEVLTNWDSGLGISIGGVPITLFTAERDNAAGATEFFGEEKVQKYLDDIEDQIGLQLRGTYQVFGYINADEGDCDMAGYLRINAEGVFATGLIVALWITGALLLVIVIALAVSVGRSIREAKQYAANSGTATPTGTAATGGSAAPDLEPVGAFTPTEPAPSEKPADKPSQAGGSDRAASDRDSGGGKAAAAGSAAWLSSQDDDAVPETQVMPAAAETEVLPVTEDAELEPVEEPVEDPEATQPVEKPEEPNTP